MTEHNNIPKHWQVKNLKSICESIQYGYTESSSKKDIGPKFLRITDIQDNKVLWDDVPYCKIDNEIKSKYLLKDGDLVFARTGATVGKSFLIKGEIPEAVFASYLIRVRVNQEINEKYLYSFFNSPNYWKQITDGQVGIGQPNVNGTKLGQLEIPLPPLPEQQAIVAKIEELLSDLENGKQQLLIAQQQLKVYRQSLLKAAFEGKLSELGKKGLKDDKITGDEEILKSSNPKNRSEAELMTVGNNPDSDNLPKGWKWMEINEIGIVKGGKRLPPKHNYAEVATGYKYIMAGNLKNGTVANKPAYIKEETFNALKNYQVTGGEVYITIVGACIGDAGVIPENIGKSILTENAAKIIELKNVQNKYLARWINSYNCQLQIKRKILSATLGKLALNRIGTIEIPLPPLEEQHQIVEILESKLTVCDKLEETISQSLRQAETLRQSILKKAFEGKLV